MTDRAKGVMHAGKYLGTDGVIKYLFLRQIAPHKFSWFVEESDGKEVELNLSGPTILEAIRLAARDWKEREFTTLGCGFRYLLPERDEHGINALFHQMAASYSSMNGIYFDEQVGNNCFVQFASIEALNVWKRLSRHDSTV